MDETDMESKFLRGNVTHLVVDSGAFVKNFPIFEIATNIYTVSEVIDEIKDRATKERLQVLPKDIVIKEPTTDSVKIVSEFSKKTGDYPVLSAVDIRLLALTYDLHVTYLGSKDLHAIPRHQVYTSNPPSALGSNLPGFYSPCLAVIPQSKTPENEVNTKSGQNDGVDCEHRGENETDRSLNCKDDTENVSDDETGWLAPENLQDAIRNMNHLNLDDGQLTVACITTDFAMQNTLIQMGLKTVSTNGFQIRHAKTYILRCFGCMKTTSKMTLEFCPHCGNKTLRRVAVTIEDDGSKIIHLSFRRPINIRGSKYSLPMPKGGKHANDPILCPDQPLPQNRPSKLGRLKTDALNDDYVAGSSPFALNDVYTRAGHLGIRGARRNPKQIRETKHHKYKK